MDREFLFLLKIPRKYCNVNWEIIPGKSFCSEWSHLQCAHFCFPIIALKEIYEHNMRFAQNGLTLHWDSTHGFNKKSNFFFSNFIHYIKLNRDLENIYALKHPWL